MQFSLLSDFVIFILSPIETKWHGRQHLHPRLAINAPEYRRHLFTIKVEMNIEWFVFFASLTLDLVRLIAKKDVSICVMESLLPKFYYKKDNLTPAYANKLPALKLLKLVNRRRFWQVPAIFKSNNHFNDNVYNFHNWKCNIWVLNFRFTQIILEIDKFTFKIYVLMVCVRVCVILCVWYLLSFR